MSSDPRRDRGRSSRPDRSTADAGAAVEPTLRHRAADRRGHRPRRRRLRSSSRRSRKGDAGRALQRSRLTSSPATSSSRRPHRSSTSARRARAGATPPIIVPSEHQQHAVHDVDRDGDRPAGRAHRPPRARSSSPAGSRTCSSSSTRSSSNLGRLARRAGRRAATSRSSPRSSCSSCSTTGAGCAALRQDRVLRAPTSDVNVTIGLALVRFFYFQFQGFRAARRPRLPRQVLRVHEFRKGSRPASSTCSSA